MQRRAAVCNPLFPFGYDQKQSKLYFEDVGGRTRDDSNTIARSAMVSRIFTLRPRATWYIGISSNNHARQSITISVFWLWTGAAIACTARLLLRDAMRERGLSRRAVLLSVCHVRGLCRNEWTCLQIFFTIWQPHHSSFYRASAHLRAILI